MYANGNSAPNDAKLKDHLANGYDFSMGDFINKGFALFKKEPGILIAYIIVLGIMYTIAGMLINLISYGGFMHQGWPSALYVVLNVALQIPAAVLSIGFYIVIGKMIKGEPHTFSNFFDGFKKAAPLIAVHFLMLLMILLGYALLVIPGIYLAISYVYAPLLVYYYDMKPWEALETSRKLVSKNWWSFFGFFIVLGLINLLGFIACGIGVLVSFPVTLCAISYAFDHVVGYPGGSAGSETIIGEQNREEY